MRKDGRKMRIVLDLGCSSEKERCASSLLSLSLFFGGRVLIFHFLSFSPFTFRAISLDLENLPPSLHSLVLQLTLSLSFLQSVLGVFFSPFTIFFIISRLFLFQCYFSVQIWQWNIFCSHLFPYIFVGLIYPGIYQIHLC